MEPRQLHTYIHLTILNTFRVSSPGTEGVWSWLMTHYAFFDHCSHNPWTYCKKLCRRKTLHEVSHILPGWRFPPLPFPNSSHRLLDAPELSWNLITPLTSMFQPQFFLQACYFGTRGCVAGEHGTMQAFQTRQLILPCLIIITDELNSLRKQNEFESPSPRTEEQTWLKSLH